MDSTLWAPQSSPLKRITGVINHRVGEIPALASSHPALTEYDAITFKQGVTHDKAFEQWATKVWNFGAGLGAEVSLKDFRKDIIIEMYNEAGQLVSPTRCFVAGCPNTRRCPIRRQRQRRRDPTYQTGERRLDSGYRGSGTD